MAVYIGLAHSRNYGSPALLRAFFRLRFAWQAIDAGVLLAVPFRLPGPWVDPDQRKPDSLGQTPASRIGRGRRQVKGEFRKVVEQVREGSAHVALARLLGVGPITHDVAVARAGLESDATDQRLPVLGHDQPSSLAGFTVELFSGLQQELERLLRVGVLTRPGQKFRMIEVAGVQRLLKQRIKRRIRRYQSQRLLPRLECPFHHVLLERRIT